MDKYFWDPLFLFFIFWVAKSFEQLSLISLCYSIGSWHWYYQKICYVSVSSCLLLSHPSRVDEGRNNSNGNLVAWSIHWTGFSKEFIYFHFQGLQCLIPTAIALTQNKSLKAINLNRPLLFSQQVWEWLWSQLRERGRSQVSTEVFMDIWTTQLSGIPYKLEKMVAGIIFLFLCQVLCSHRLPQFN